METFSALLAICAGNSPVTGEFAAQMPVTHSFDIFFDLRLYTWLSKQPQGWWFETQSRPLWRHCNDYDFELIAVSPRDIDTKLHINLSVITVTPNRARPSVGTVLTTTKTRYIDTSHSLAIILNYRFPSPDNIFRDDWRNHRGSLRVNKLAQTVNTGSLYRW